jgi:thiamine-monophosphate kinase
MIDLSDGLLADLGHILDLSSVGARIISETLPLSEQFRQHFPTVTEEALSLALAGGEDYELLFTVPPEKIPDVFSLLNTLGTPVTVIGTITEGRAVTVIGPNGTEISLKRKGYDHFSPRDGQ